MAKIYTGENIKEGIRILVDFMKEAKYTVVLTGASIDTFEENYSLFRDFYSERIKRLKDVKPHEGHYVLADFEKRGIIKYIATQNVSDLHRMAGNEKVYELHGNIRKIRCNYCNHKAELEDFLNREKCANCGRDALRPEVVLFGEALPMDEWLWAEEDIRKSDLIIVIGTSLEVAPVKQLPMLTRGKRVLINMEDVDIYYDFDLKLMGNTLINNALVLATKIHKDQTRKGTDIPYIVHPFEVALILQENGADEEMIAAGLLHDVLEDGELDLDYIKNEIKTKLSGRVLEYVIGASERLENRDKTPWRERKWHTIEYLKDKNTPREIKMISCADKLSNARSLFRDLKTEGNNLWNRFNAGYEMQKKYYEGLVESLKDLEGLKMYEEFKEVVRTIFG